MEYVEAPIDFSLDRCSRPWIFLAGGITKCPDWQQEVRGMLELEPLGTMLNPRRAQFPMGDPEQASIQIAWEHRALWACDIFSMWFCNAESDQPICMFELGTHTARWRLNGHPKLVIGVESGYRREVDVVEQMHLLGIPPTAINPTLHWQASAIVRAVTEFLER